MKRAKFYTLVNRYGFWDIVSVASEKGGQYHGSVVDGSPTHLRAEDGKGRFPTVETALNAKSLIRANAEHHKALRKPHEAEIIRLYNAERQTVDAIVKAVIAETGREKNNV